MRRPSSSTALHRHSYIPARHAFLGRGLFGLLLLALAFVPVSAQTVSAQTTVALNLPAAPVPANLTAPSSSSTPGAYGIMLPPPAAAQHRARWRSSLALSIYALAAAETFDMDETHRVLAHPQWICGYNPAIGGTAITAMTASSPATAVSQVCGASPTGELANYAYQGDFQEAGWTTQFHLAAPRNFPGVLSWNIGLDASQVAGPLLLRHRLPARGIFASELTNFAHAAAHFYGGFYDRNYIDGPAGSPNTYMTHYEPQLTQSFPGPRWWGRK